MDAVALASVITSGVIGISGIGAALWTSGQAATLARETRSQERLASAYLEVLGMVELEGQWFQSSADNLVARTDLYFSGTATSLSKPELAKRSRARALLGAFGSAQVKQRYLAWTLAAASIDEEHSILEWNWHEESGDPNRPIDPTTLKSLLERLQPAEVAAREALACAVAGELGVAESLTQVRF